MEGGLGLVWSDLVLVWFGLVWLCLVWIGVAQAQALTRVKKVNSRVEREIKNSDLEFRE